MKNTTRNSVLLLESAKIGDRGVVSISLINPPSLILLGIIIPSLLGIPTTVIG
ncbi:MAG: hypothetical protein KJ799_08010 [Bacteroidetes bacterium]|nr:hypothetical protein [Bacteroidota bacterium]MBU1679236.1 hypothetical protein [Bacteroidota bacterium]MBU2506653.1 hypothetical protein [Bacteroidota bacterium]